MNVVVVSFLLAFVSEADFSAWDVLAYVAFFLLAIGFILYWDWMPWRQRPHLPEPEKRSPGDPAQRQTVKKYKL